jgi:hypothetical protein
MGIDAKGFRKYIQSKMKKGMYWKDHSVKWFIQFHISILPDEEYTLEELKSRMNYKHVECLHGAHHLSPHYNPDINPLTGEYNCSVCGDFKTDRSDKYNRHLETKKHLKNKEKVENKEEELNKD